jgi:hypothetical protein
MLFCLVLAACEELRQIGSQCRNGLCELDPAPNSPTCLVATQNLRLYPNLEESVLPCSHPRQVRNDSGLTPCEMYWSAIDPLAVPPVLQNCSGFLTPADAVPDAGPRCRVTQVSVANDGAPSADTEGFYYLDQAPDDLPVCDDGMGPGAFRYTAGISLPEGVRHDIVCTTTQTAGPGGALRAIDPEECAEAERDVSSGTIGAPCSPTLQPAAGFAQASASLETSNRDCGAAHCMVFHVEGVVSDACADDPTAIDPPLQCASDAAERIYCSCRCDVPESESEPACTCPSDFSCTPVIEQGQFAGSYCVRSDQIGWR